MENPIGKNHWQR